MNVSTYSNLSACISGILASEAVEMREIIVCFFDVSQTCGFEYGAGLRANMELFWSQAGHARKPGEGGSKLPQEVIRPARPIIVLGLAPTLEIAASRLEGRDKHMIELFQWPGATYMQYGFTREQLMTTARRVVEGSETPLQLGAWLKSDGILRVTSEVRHWLENRRTNVTGMRDDFRKALNGAQLSPFYLEPQSAVAEEHRKMVERLWAYEWLAVELASESGGVGPLRVAMADFERRWDALEKAKLAYRKEAVRGIADREKIKSVAFRIDQVLVAVRTAIDATRVLDAAIQQK